MRNFKIFVLKALFLSAALFACSPVFSQEQVETDKTNSAGIDSVNTISDKTGGENEPSDNVRGSNKLGKIVVTPTKNSRKTADSPASVSVIDSDDISVSSGKYADETMKSVSGVYLKRSKFGDTTTSVNIRGFSGSRRNLVLFNGMPINDGYSTAVDWSGISSDSIDSIEIVKGPFSSLYGRNAMGGVINMITTTPEKQEISVKTGYGTNNTYTGSVSYGDRLFDSLGILLSGNYASTDGHRSNLVRTSFATGTTGTAVTGMEPDTDTTGSPVVTSGSTAGQPYFLIGDKGKNYFERWGSTGKIDYDITSNSEISYTFNVQDYKYGYRDARSYLKNSSGSSVSSGTVTFNYDGTNYSKTIYQNTFLDGPGENFSHLHVLDYNLKSDMFGFAAKAGYSSSEKWYTTPNTGSTGADFSGGPGKVSRTDPKRTLYTDVQCDYSFTEFMAVTLGGGTRYDTAENDEYNITDWKDPDSETGLPSDHVSDMKGKQLFSSAYSQFEFSFFKKVLNLYLGARYDHWKNYDGSSRYKAVDKDYGTTTDNYVSPKVSVLIKPEIGAKIIRLESLRSSYGHSYSPPDLYQLYRYWEGSGTEYYPNPDLKPEQSRSWEAGVDISFFSRTVLVTTTYFGSIIKDMFYNKVVTPSSLSKAKMYANAGEGEISGYEAEIKIFPVDFIELYSNITKTSTEITKNVEDPASKGKDFTNVPELMYNAGLKLFSKKAEGSINWRYCDKVYNSSDNSDTADKTYGVYDEIRLLDLKLSVMPHDNVKFSFTVNNALDREYYQYYLCEGRTYFAEAEIKL